MLGRSEYLFLISEKTSLAQANFMGIGCFDFRNSFIPFRNCPFVQRGYYRQGRSVASREP